MSDEGTVSVVGSINFDLTFQVGFLPSPGTTTLAHSRVSAQGGKGANQAVAAAAAGAQVAFIGAIGNDKPGQEALANLACRGIDVSAVRTVDKSTGTAFVFVDDRGENCIVVDPGANALATLDLLDLPVSNVVLSQLEIPLATVHRVGKMKGEALFVLNPAPMPGDPREVLAMLSTVDVLVPNRSELAKLTRRPEPLDERGVHECAIALGFPGLLVVTLGADGALIFGPGGSDILVRKAATPITVTDTSGAGDVLCGVLAASLAGGSTIEAAIGRAVDAASQSTTRQGAQLSLGTTIR